MFYLNDVTLPQRYRVIGLQRRMNMAFVLILDVAGLIIKNIFFYNKSRYMYCSLHNLHLNSCVQSIFKNRRCIYKIAEHKHQKYNGSKIN